MLGDQDKVQLQPQQQSAAAAAPLGGGGDNRKIYSRSVSWAGKARATLPPLQPLSVSRPRAEEWPRAGSDDLGVWPNVAATTPGVKPRPPALPLNLNKGSGKPPREFEFKKDKLAFFDKECSRIMDHVFLGSDAIAKNRDVLRQNGITHVLNCVGFVCPEYFKNDLVYKTLWLQDSPSEDITSILYDVFDYFEDVKEQNGRVFVHCCQGVSRSTSLVIAYLMWRDGQSFDTAFQQVKAARGVTNPNMGFASQLLQCQKRVLAVPVSPNSVLRMYRIAPHSSYAPLHLVPKLLARPNAQGLDSRGAFIVNVPSAIYVWIGKNCDPLMNESAKLAASQVIRYEKVNGPALTVKEGEEPIEFWNAIRNDQDEEQFLGNRGVAGQRIVVDYDIDFGVFAEAANSGVVPPFSISGTNSEMCLPARRSGWERLRRKFATGVMKELITSSKEIVAEAPCDSPDSCSSVSARNWVKTTGSKEDEDDNYSECMSPDSFSSFLVKDQINFDNTSPSVSPSTSDTYSFTFSPTSSNWSDLSVSAQPSPSGLEATHPNPNLNPNPEFPKSLVRTWSFSLEDQSMEDAADEDDWQECMNDDLSDRSTEADFVLYQWPAMEKVEMGSAGIPDSRSVYITYVADVLFIWVGRDVPGNSNNSRIEWQMVGHDFLVKEGLSTSSIVQIVKEGEEPEKLWKHLHCFSFPNTAEKDQK
uniref:Protein-tyrosine-phosphatase MKP1-like n=1 Tax=Tanacetum cinerariifolium TaxID=118510 RepID=A0A6L2NCG2_TANCI|nr:protein-tyrosine-phosphatase MKP1-like [Tanacetum cinerariifolium]